MTETCSECTRPEWNDGVCKIHHEGTVECLDCGTEIMDNAGTRPPVECDDCAL